MFTPIGGLQGQSYAAIEAGYLNLFWSFAFIMILVLAISWYIYTKDKSEALAIGLAPTILLWFGVEDVLFYKIQGIPFESQMEWLHAVPGVEITSKLMGSTTITGQILMTSAVIGIILTYIIVKKLKKI